MVSSKNNILERDLFLKQLTIIIKMNILVNNPNSWITEDLYLIFLKSISLFYFFRKQNQNLKNQCLIELSQIRKRIMMINCSSSFFLIYQLQVSFLISIQIFMYKLNLKNESTKEYFKIQKRRTITQKVRYIFMIFQCILKQILFQIINFKGKIKYQFINLRAQSKNIQLPGLDHE
ncbi:hypothetical protein ABPG72_015549 [Tetrahymena utriculariae]